MINKQFIFKFLFSALLIWVLGYIVNAQQLYINNTYVYYATGPSVNAMYCAYKNPSSAVNITDRSSITDSNNARIEFEQPRSTYPGNCLMLCASIKCSNPPLLQNGVKETSPSFGIDTLKFEVFKYEGGTNPLGTDVGPVSTIFLHDINYCPGTKVVNGVISGSEVVDNSVGTYCSAWDADHNIDGEFGKRNGRYGFRATVSTNQSSAEIGTISIDNTSVYPGESQRAIQVDVVNIHAVRSTPTVVGFTSAVAAQPYQIKYRISKDALVSMKIIENSTTTLTARTLFTNIPRIGEVQPDGTLANVDVWDGRDNQGRLLGPANYVVSINAQATDIFGPDSAFEVSRQLSIDPIRVTDYKITPLGPKTTDVAAISYLVTEPSEVFIIIHSSDTVFSDTYQQFPSALSTGTPFPTLTTGKVVRTLSTQVRDRATLFTYWDGRDDRGNPLKDGNYVAAVIARAKGAVKNPGGTAYVDGYVYGSKFDVKIVPIARGQIATSNLVPVTTIIGSSPTVSGLPTFQFKYSLSRGANVDMNIFRVNSNSSGVIISTPIVRHLLAQEARMGEFAHTEDWDGADDNGYMVSSGTYLVELLAYDTIFPDEPPFRLTTSITIDQLRITDVRTTPLLGGTSDYASVTYLLSRSMDTTINIYRPGTQINTAGTWPPVLSTAPVKSITGIRPGRLPITEFWDGIYNDQMLADGEYVFSLTARSSDSMADYSGCATNVCTPAIVNKPYVLSDRITGKITVFRGPVYVSNLSAHHTYPATVISSSSTVKLPPISINFEVTRVSSITIQAVSDTRCNMPPYSNNVCRTIISGVVYNGSSLETVYWDGLDDYSKMLPKDTYMIRVIAHNYPQPELQNPTTSQIPVELDPYQVFDTGIRDVNAQAEGAVAYQVSVPMTVAVQIFKPGTVIGSDGNPTPPIASGSLVNVLYGVRPQLVPQEEVWDGRDSRDQVLPDGAYVYRIVTSTMSEVINHDTGEFLNNNIKYVADENMYIYGWGNITVSLNATAGDIAGDFNSATIFYPNPLRKAKGTFEISKTPAKGYYSLRMYNLAGDLVYDKDFGYIESNRNFKWDWTRVNSSGRPVARGIYYAVLELKEVGGGGNTYQTTKKILVP